MWNFISDSNSHEREKIFIIKMNNMAYIMLDTIRLKFPKAIGLEYYQEDTNNRWLT